MLLCVVVPCCWWWLLSLVGGVGGCPLCAAGLLNRRCRLLFGVCLEVVRVACYCCLWLVSVAC